MSDIIRTEQTYKTRENAEKALLKKLALANVNPDAVRYLIAATANGRFAPALVGQAHIQLALGIQVTVVG